MRLFPRCLLVLLLLPIFCFSQNLGFDLAGPPVDVKVERGNRTLPIAEVPSLQAGDRLWIHPNFPDSQSVHYLLIVAFLRGSTNPPPDSWFTKAETWNKAVRDEGIFVTVPQEAQQAIVFLAPQATGDFSTLRSAVRGRPGAFVRSSQDLQQASLDRARLDRYLTEVKSISENDPKNLKPRSVALAHNLRIKIDEKCFDLPVEQQYSCLTQNSDQLILDDSSTQSMLARVSNGATADLMNQISYSHLAGAGTYSAYVGAIIDFARIMGSLHTAQYQYIPALAVPHNDSLSLRLNNPPSFRKPQSVLVVSLPPVQKTPAPVLHATDADQSYCLDSPSPVLATEGAPLVFATQFAHDLVLHIEDASGHKADLPLVSDPARGGFSLKVDDTKWDKFDRDLTGTMHGQWGFDPFHGPKFALEIAKPQRWEVEAADKTALVVGRDDVLHLTGESTACVSSVKLVESHDKAKSLTYKASHDKNLEIKVPLESDKPGEVKLAVAQYGISKPDEVTAQSYAEAAQFDHFTLNAGDDKGTLEGKRLDEVGHVELNGVRFEPADLTRRADHDELKLKADNSTDDLTQGSSSAKVVLADGRSFKLPATVLAPRPKVTILSKGVQTDDPDPTVVIGSNDELPATGRIVFSLKSVVPPAFPHSEQIEIAASDDSFHARLSTTDGTLVLQDAETAVATVDPKKTFGDSAFGPMRIRAVSADGTTGDWQPLGTLVRLPVLKEVSCPPGAQKPCSLSGSNLFLLNAVSTTQDFVNPTAVPDGFTGQALTIPHPTGGTLYFRLRDDPTVVQTEVVPVLKDNAATASLHSGQVNKKKSE